jgi:hypothetical protein
MIKKVKSTTLWFAIWAAALLSLAVALKFEAAWFGGTAPILGAIILGYVAGNKAYDFKRGRDE